MKLINKIREEILRMYSDACDLETLAVLSIVAGIPASVMKNIKKPFGTEEETSNKNP